MPDAFANTSTPVKHQTPPRQSSCLFLYVPLFSDKPHAAFQTTQLCDQRPLKTTKKIQSRAKRGVPKKKPTSFNSFLCCIISSACLSVVRAPKETKRARPLLLLLVCKGSARANVLPANFFFQPNWAVISTVSAGHGRQRRWASVRAPVATTLPCGLYLLLPLLRIRSRPCLLCRIPTSAMSCRAMRFTRF